MVFQTPKPTTNNHLMGHSPPTWASSRRFTNSKGSISSMYAVPREGSEGLGRGHLSCKRTFHQEDQNGHHFHVLRFCKCTSYGIQIRCIRISCERCETGRLNSKRKEAMVGPNQWSHNTARSLARSMTSSPWVENLRTWGNLGQGDASRTAR